MARIGQQLSCQKRGGKNKKNCGQRKKTTYSLGQVALKAERELESFCTPDGRNDLLKPSLLTPGYAILT